MFGRLRERWSLKACTELSNTYSEHQNYDILATKLSIYERAHSHTGTQAHTHAHRAHAHKRKHTHTELCCLRPFEQNTPIPQLNEHQEYSCPTKTESVTTFANCQTIRPTKALTRTAESVLLLSFHKFTPVYANNLREPVEYASISARDAGTLLLKLELHVIYFPKLLL